MLLMTALLAACAHKPAPSATRSDFVRPFKRDVDERLIVVDRSGRLLHPVPGTTTRGGTATEVYSKKWEQYVLGRDGEPRATVRRTYERTDGPHVFVQLEISAIAVALELSELRWESEAQFAPLTVADDLYIEYADARPQWNRRAHRTRTRFTKTSSGTWHRPLTPSPLEPGWILIVTAVFGPEAMDGFELSGDEWQHYAHYGLLARQGAGYTFDNWNPYELMNRLGPLFPGDVGPPRQAQFIRLAMHLVERMRDDDGWPRTALWSPSYPAGDRFSVHARSFAAIAYLWAYLRQRGQDAQVLLDALQATRPYFIPRDTGPSFADEHDGVPYISYSAARREKTHGSPRGVLNTHAHALHFASVMREASEIAGDRHAAEQWGSIVGDYHRGSKALFELLYPGRIGDRTYTGLVDYSLEASFERIKNIAYNSMSFLGIASGYELTGERELRFVDAVERASRLDYDPMTDGDTTAPTSIFVGRLCRLEPAAIAFTTPHVRMWSAIASASLAELLEPERSTSPHDPKRVIAVRNQTFIRTNARFKSDWVKGFWYERDDVPAPWQFDAGIEEGDGTWVVYRTGDRIEAMTDREIANVWIELPKSVPWVSEVRAYEGGRWSGPTRVSAGTGRRIGLRLPAKALGIVRILDDAVTTSSDSDR